MKKYRKTQHDAHASLTDYKKRTTDIETEFEQPDVSSYASSQKKKTYKKFETNVAHAARTLEQLFRRGEELGK